MSQSNGHVALIEQIQHAGDFRCPICRRRVFSISNGNVRLLTRILVFENGNTLAKCKHCRSDIKVPIEMEHTAGQESLTVWED